VGSKAKILIVECPRCSAELEVDLREDGVSCECGSSWLVGELNNSIILYESPADFESSGRVYLREFTEDT
jgi:hypothetical protein